MIRIGKLSLIIFFILISVTVSAKKPDNKYSESISPVPAGATILVLPLNDNQQLGSREIADVEKEIFVQLKATGAVPKKGKITNPEDKLDYTLLTSDRAYGDLKAEKAKQEYVAGVASNFDLVIIPSTYETLGFMDKELIAFDGAKIRIETVEGRTGNWSGSQRGISLRFEVYDTTGAWLMTLKGGIAMPRIATLATREFNRKEYLFEKKRDKKYLSKGVAIVIKPLKKKLKFK